MATCRVHAAHPHVHHLRCDHPDVIHHDHIDHLHNGHLHHTHDDHIDEHVVEVDATNPDRCTPRHDCGGTDHDERHVHSHSCGHLLVPHGDHHDHWVRDHLHHPHGDHCDDHGPLHRRPPVIKTLKTKQHEPWVHGELGGKDSARAPPHPAP